ncbi:MAG: hypothetical protein WAW37_15270 [Syntrophobacteraceae bacterium]
MITIALAFFGITLLYTGFLVFDRDAASGIAAAIMGVVLLAKPALDGVRYLRTHFQRPPPKGKSKGKPPKTHLRVVEPGDKKPTIH